MPAVGSWPLTSLRPLSLSLRPRMKNLRRYFVLTTWILLLKWLRTTCFKLRAVSQCYCRLFFFLNSSYFSQIFTKFHKFYFLKCNAVEHPWKEIMFGPFFQFSSSIICFRCIRCSGFFWCSRIKLSVSINTFLHGWPQASKCRGTRFWSFPGSRL